MASMEARLEALLVQVEGLHGALADEVKERQRDHDTLTRLHERFKAAANLFDGFIQERTHDRRKLDELKDRIERFENRLKPVEEWKTARENSRNSARIEAFNEVKEKRKMRWDLIAAVCVGLFCAVAGVMFDRLVFREKPPTVHQLEKKEAQAPKQP